MDNKSTVLFVYSEMQINKDKEINKKIGKEFVCGEVVIGNDRKQYSKIIQPNMLKAMTALYPDIKVVYEGSKSQTTYTPIRTGYLK